MLQIIRSNKDNLEISITILLHKNIFCDSPLEPFHCDGSNEGSQHMFSFRNKKHHFLIILNTASYQSGAQGISTLSGEVTLAFSISFPV